MEVLKLSLLVGVGGFFGTSLRFITNALVEKIIPVSVFPLGTILVNIIGCLCIGIFTWTCISRDNNSFIVCFKFITEGIIPSTMINLKR